MKASKYGRTDPLKCQPQDPRQAEEEWLVVRDGLVPLVEPSTIRRAIENIGGLAPDGTEVTIEKIRRDVIGLAESHELTRFQRALLQGYIWEFCKQDPQYWADLFGWVYDFRERRDRVEEPFVMWESQREVFHALIAHLHGNCSCGFKDLVINKITRREGGTYLTIFAAIHDFLFYNYVHIGFVSLNFDDVDKKPDSIFAKIDRILERLPVWLLPAGWNKNRNKAPFCRSEGYIRKPGYDASSDSMQTAMPLCTLYGESTTTTLGISQGVSALIFDELGRIGDEGKPKGIDREIWERNADTTHCRVAVSTIGGPSTQHTILVRSADSEYPLCHVVTLAWYLNPRENKGMRTFEVFPPEMRWDYKTGHNLLRERYGVEARWAGLSEDDKKHWERKWATWEKNEEFEGKRFSGWYLDACCRRLTDNDSMQAIRTELDGEPKQSGLYLFPAPAIHKKIAELGEPLYKGRIEDKVDKEGNVEIEFQKGYGPITIFEEADPVEQYVATADSAGGDGKDFSVSHVFIVSQWPPREVALLRDNRLGPTKQTECIHYLIRRYCDAFFVPEYNYGRSVIEVMTHRFGYFRIYTRHDPTNIFDDSGSKYGYFTGANKPTLIHDFREAFLAGQIVIRSKETLEEMLHFVDHSEKLSNNDYGAERGFHDDCIISAALLVPGVKYLTGGRFRPVSSMKKMKKEEETRRQIVFDYPRIGIKGYRTYIVKVPEDAESPEPADVYAR